MIQIKF